MKTKHGLSRTKLYRRWASAKYRCCNPNDPGYKNYGGRGINMFDEWKTDFKAYYDYVTSLDSYDSCKVRRGIGELTLDRIDNNGNYEPGNLRWTDWQTQALNKRRSKRYKYAGVYFRKTDQRGYYYQIRHNGYRAQRGPFDTEFEAAKARDRFIIEKGIDPMHLQVFKKVSHG